MKRVLKIVLKVTIIVAIIVILAFLIQDSSHVLRGPSYDASAPTSKKFSMIKRWIPTGSELVAVVDPQRLFSEPGSRAKLMRRLDRSGSLWGLDLGLIRNLVAQPGNLGLIAVSLKLEDRPIGLAVVQGNLNKADIVNGVKSIMKDEGEELVLEQLDKISLYSESISEDAFAFAFPDRHHMIIGPKQNVRSLLLQDVSDTQPEVDLASPQTDTPLFGRILITHRVERFLPPQLGGINRARFSSTGGFVVDVEIPCASVRQAEDLTIFTEGWRLSYLLTGNGESKLESLLKGIRITQNANMVMVSLPLGELL